MRLSIFLDEPQVRLGREQPPQVVALCHEQVERFQTVRAQELASSAEKPPAAGDAPCVGVLGNSATIAGKLRQALTLLSAPILRASLVAGVSGPPLVFGFFDLLETAARGPRKNTSCPHGIEKRTSNRAGHQRSRRFLPPRGRSLVCGKVTKLNS